MDVDAEGQTGAAVLLLRPHHDYGAAFLLLSPHHDDADGPELLDQGRRVAVLLIPVAQGAKGPLVVVEVVVGGGDKAMSSSWHDVQRNGSRFCLISLYDYKELGCTILSS